MVKTPPKKVFWGDFKGLVPSQVFGPLGFKKFAQAKPRSQERSESFPHNLSDQRGLRAPEGVSICF